MEVLVLIASDMRQPEPPLVAVDCGTGWPDRRREGHGDFYFLPGKACSSRLCRCLLCSS